MTLLAQASPGLQFNHLTTVNGLSSNTATCVAEDGQGFIWIGTDNGLNRYDGYRMKQFYHNDADSNSLVCSIVQALHCDRKGRLWIVTAEGISCFLPQQNRFLNYSTRLPAPRRLKNNVNAMVSEDADGTIWITDQEEVIFKVDGQMNLQPVVIHVPPFRLATLLKQGYDRMMQDHEGHTWAVCGAHIYLLDPRTRQPQATYDFTAQLPHASITSLVEDSQGHYWVTTWGSQLWQFLPGEHLLKPAASDIPVTSITEWPYEGHPWMAAIGTFSGLYLLNGPDDIFKKISWNPNDPYSVQGTVFFSIFTDRRKDLWVCTNNGVNYVETGKKLFDILPITEPGTSNYQRDRASIPFSYFEGSTGTWIAKQYKSTFLFDDSLHIKRFYTSLYPLSTTSVQWRRNADYFFERGNDLYMTTDTGLVIYDTKRATSRLYLPSGINEAELRTMVALDSERLLIRSVSHGLFVFDMRTKRFINPVICHDAGTPPRLNYMIRTTRGHIYLSGDAGNSLLQYDPACGTLTSIEPRNEKAYHLLDNKIMGMDEDSSGRLWLASTSGIFIYDPSANQVEAHFNENGRMGEQFRICFDRYHNAWTNGNTGIWCYLSAQKRWLNFNASDGLPGSDFEGIITRRKNGDIVAGLEGALAIFHPGQLYAGSEQLSTVITEASINDSILPFPLLEGLLRLQPDQNSFSVDFAVPGSANPSYMQYRYRLEPLMSSFRANSNGHINFNGLMPGHYILHVKGMGKAGEQAREARLDIVIEPHWYQTWWSRALAVLILVAVISWIARGRIAAIRRSSALRQRIVETEMQALRAQMDPHFIFNSLSSIENFIMKNEKRMASDYLNKFARLIRLILDASREELVSVATDLEALQLYVDLQQISYNNKFTFVLHADPALLQDDYRVPPLLVQPYVENAIVHGLSHSQASDLRLSVHATLESDHIRYVVEDNGIGREKAQIYNQRNKPLHKSVGLKITEERIQIFSRRTKSRGSVSITDLYDAAGTPCGTRVNMIIKAM